MSTGLFRDRTCNLALVTQNIQWLLLMGVSFVVSVFLQEVRGYSAIGDRRRLHRCHGRRPRLVLRSAASRQEVRATNADRLGLPRHARRHRAAARLRPSLVESRRVRARPSADRRRPRRDAHPLRQRRTVEFPRGLQGEISGLSRSVSNLGSSFGTAIAGTILISVVALGTRSYAVAMITLAGFGLIGLVAALRIPAKIEPVQGD